MRFPHPDYLLPYLSSEQFEDWAAYYELHPWGEDREDQRFEASRVRTLVGLFGSAAGDKNTRAFYPYFPKPADPQEELAAMRATEARLKWDGTKHVWVN